MSQTPIPCPECKTPMRSTVFGMPTNNGGEIQYFICEKCKKDYAEDVLFP